MEYSRSFVVNKNKSAMINDTDRTLALAGVFQAAVLTHQIAQRGLADSAPYEASLGSIAETDPADVPAVFGGVAGVRKGLQVLLAQLDRTPGERNLEITRYAMTLLQLGGRLLRDTRRLKDIGDGIDAVKQRTDSYPLGHQNQLALLAEIYQRNVSTLSPRVMVTGEPLHLQNPDNQNRIRSILLAGVRSAILWQQCGGSRLKLLFGRRKLVETARHLLADTDETV